MSDKYKIGRSHLVYNSFISWICWTKLKTIIRQNKVQIYKDKLITFIFSKEFIVWVNKKIEARP